jgi:hypothetical protein
MTTPTQNGVCSSTDRASPPNRPTRPSQAIEDSHWTTAGRITVAPNAIREAGSWPVPVRGPQVDR